MDIAESHGDWVKPNRYQAGVIEDLLITALRGLQETSQPEIDEATFEMDTGEDLKPVGSFRDSA